MSALNLLQSFQMELRTIYYTLVIHYGIYFSFVEEARLSNDYNHVKLFPPSGFLSQIGM